MLTLDLFQKIIDEVEKHVCYLVFYFQGEPFLNPKFLKMVKIAHQKKIYTETSTNAHFLKEVKWIEHLNGKNADKLFTQPFEFIGMEKLK